MYYKNNKTKILIYCGIEGEDEDQNKLVNFKKLFGGPSMGLYEIKKLSRFFFPITCIIP